MPSSSISTPRTARTQMRLARNGEITPAMEFVAEREATRARARSRRGRPRPPGHPRQHPPPRRHARADGASARSPRVKINANIGNSAVSSSIDEEVGKLLLAVKYGADTVMDLSTGKDIDVIARGDHRAPRRCRSARCRSTRRCCMGKELEELTANDLLDVIEHQAQQGVDYMTLHAGILLEHLPLVYGRVTGIVSRGGSLHAVWMMHHRKQNPLYEHYDDVLDILRHYDVTISLGDSLRPGSIARRERQGAVRRARDAGRADEARVGARRPGDGRRARPHPDAPDRDERPQAEGGLSRGAVLHARSARHGHRARATITSRARSAPR